MDIGPKFLDDQGVFLPNAFRPDNLHPMAGGYEIWGEAVRARLAQLLK
jgi:lysophospholipase L1-like esterase